MPLYDNTIIPIYENTLVKVTLFYFRLVHHLENEMAAYLLLQLSLLIQIKRQSRLDSMTTMEI